MSQYVDNRFWANATRTLIQVVAAIAIANLVWLVLGDAHLQSPQLVPVFQMAPTVQFIASLAAGAVWLIWEYRAVANASRLGIGVGQPWVAVIWWIIPVAFFFKPYQVIRDLYKGIATPEMLRKKVAYPGGWWLSFTVALVASRAAGSGIDAH